MEFGVFRMSSRHCRAAITKIVTGLDPAAQVAVGLPSRTVEIDTERRFEDVHVAIRDSGYESAPA